MKRFLFILLLAPAGAMAQRESLPQQPFSKSRLDLLEKARIFKADTSQPDYDRVLTRPETGLWLAQGKYSHTTSQGKVYHMPFDSMSCLVPDAKKLAPMPVSRMKPNSRMPNAFPRMQPDSKGKRP